MLEAEQLKQIYHLMYGKLREIQLDDAFEETMKDNRTLSYVGKSDDYFFSRMVSVIFESGIRAVVWMKYAPETKKAFADYKVKKIAKYTKKDLERMLRNPKMFKNRKKIEACIHNAKEIVESLVITSSSLISGFNEDVDLHLDLVFTSDIFDRFVSHFKWVID